MRSKKSSAVLLLSIIMLALASYSKLNALYKRQVKNRAGYETGITERQLRSIKIVPAAILFILNEYH